MAYYESAEDILISRERAYEELGKHGVSGEWEMFLSDMGDKEEYKAQDVLAWLGY